VFERWPGSEIGGVFSVSIGGADAAVEARSCRRRGIAHDRVTQRISLPQCAESAHSRAAAGAAAGLEPATSPPPTIRGHRDYRQESGVLYPLSYTAISGAALSRVALNALMSSPDESGCNSTNRLKTPLEYVNEFTAQGDRARSGLSPPGAATPRRSMPKARFQADNMAGAMASPHAVDVRDVGLERAWSRPPNRRRVRAALTPSRRAMDVATPRPRPRPCGRPTTTVGSRPTPRSLHAPRPDRGLPASSHRRQGCQPSIALRRPRPAR
jgi:hypothetical protein